MLNNIYKSCLMIFMCFTYLSCIAEEFSYYQEKQKSTHSHTIERKNSSACTTHCGIRTEISSNYQTPKSYSNYNRSYYASLSPTDFKYLLHNICDTNEVLNQYPLYAFENFLIFARTLPDYQAHILSLNQKIQRDKNFKKQTAYMPYFDYSFGIGYEKSEFHDLIATEAQKIIKNQPKQNSFTPQTSRHIQTNTLQYNDLILKKLNSRYSEKIKTINDSNISIRLIDRINVINQIYKSKPKHFDYSEQIAQLHLNYDNEKIFQNTYGTQLDYQLHKELCQTRSTLFSLERTYSYNHHIQTLAPIVYNYTTQAKQETCPITAFELSDFCHLITQVLSQGMKALYHTSLAIDNGIQQGISEFCSVKHWQDMATGAMHFGLLFADAIGKEDALHYAMILNATSNDSEPLINAAKQYCKYTQEQKDALNLGLHNTYKKIQSTSWPDIVEHGVQIGSTIILDILTFNAINGFSRTASNLAIKQLSNSLEGATLLTKEYMVEVAGFGKLIIEEGPEVTTVASDTIKNDFTFFKHHQNKKPLELIHKIAQNKNQNISVLTKTQPIWKATNFAPGKLEAHFNKHVIKKAEWGTNLSMTLNEYLINAQTLLNSEINNFVQGFTSKEGWVFRYNSITNELAIAKPNGIIETFFRPANGQLYWLEQVQKYK